MSLLHLKTEGGEIVKVESELLTNVSTTIRDMVESCEDMKGEDDNNEADKEEIPIPLQNVSKRTLELIIEWATQHKDDGLKGIDKANLNKQRSAEDMSDWDREFVDKLDRKDVFDILLAANFLDIKALLDLGCQKTILMIRGKSVEEMREILGVEDDLTPELREQIRKENEWCEEN